MADAQKGTLGLSREEVAVLTEHYVRLEREGRNTEEEGASILLLGAFREYYELTERLGEAFKQLPTAGLKEHLMKNLEGLVEFAESVVRNLSTDKLDYMKECNLRAERHLEGLLRERKGTSQG